MDRLTLVNNLMAKQALETTASNHRQTSETAHSSNTESPFGDVKFTRETQMPGKVFSFPILDPVESVAKIIELGRPTNRGPLDCEILKYRTAA